MRETTVEQYLSNKVKANGGLSIKLSPLYFAGIPDRLILLPFGKVCFIETKAPGKLASKLQLAVHKRLQKLGFLVYKVDNYADINRIIDNLMLG